MTDEMIGQLAAALQGTSVSVLEWQDGERLVRLTRDGALAGQAAVPQLPVEVRAAHVGVFHLRHPAAPDLLMQVGQVVRAGQVIGLLQAGPVYLPVVAPRSGVVVSIAAAAGSMLGHGSAICMMAAEGD